MKPKKFMSKDQALKNTMAAGNLFVLIKRRPQ